MWEDKYRQQEEHRRKAEQTIEDNRRTQIEDKR